MRLLGIVLVVAVNGGCGQKGPLFLPQEKLDELERKRDEDEPQQTGAAPVVLATPDRA